MLLPPKITFHPPVWPIREWLDLCQSHAAAMLGQQYVVAFNMRKIMDTLEAEMPDWLVAEYRHRDVETIIPVQVGEKTYDTVVVGGVQWFKENPHHFLLRQTNKVWDTYLGCYISDLNTMALRYQRGEFSQVDYAEMNMALGYSLCAFNFLSWFQDMQLSNPLWCE